MGNLEGVEWAIQVEGVILELGQDGQGSGMSIQGRVG
jgi:hypothetical protein